MSITALATGQQARPAVRSGARTVADLLTAAANADRNVRLAEAERLDLAAQWADANPTTEHNPLPARLHHRGEDLPAHPGLTHVTASAVAELAAQFALTTHAGTSLIADTLEIRARLPRIWDLVMTGQFHTWRARQLAQATAPLNDAAADWIDHHAAVAGLHLGPRQLDELVLRATHLHDPDQLPDTDDATFVRISSSPDDTTGMANLDGRLSGIDAADLDAALQAEATQLRRDGDTGSLDQRRATALGNLARSALGQDTLPADQPADDAHAPRQHSHPAEAPQDDQPSGTTAEPTPRPTQRPITRKLTLYAFLSAAALGIGAGCPHCAGATLAAAPALGTLVTPQVIRDWCGQPDIQVTITPVIDTTTLTSTTADVPTPTMQAQIALRDRTCVFPYCHAPAHPQPRSLGKADRPDLDHIQPRNQGGPTSTDNLAALCRRHHRLKTFTGWRYRQLTPHGIYLWTSPAGVHYLTTPTTTINLDQPDRYNHRSDRPSPEHRASVEHARQRIALRERFDATGPPADQHNRPAGPGGDPPCPDPDPAPF